MRLGRRQSSDFLQDSNAHECNTRIQFQFAMQDYFLWSGLMLFISANFPFSVLYNDKQASFGRVIRAGQFVTAIWGWSSTILKPLHHKLIAMSSAQRTEASPAWIEDHSYMPKLQSFRD